MPRYEFKCNRCGGQFEISVSISQKNKTKCPECKSPNIAQILSNFYVKGSLSCKSCKATSCDTCSLK